MDPASLAIGILPLVINIVEASSAVRQKLSDYRSAPADVQNIIDKTELIGMVCSRLEVDLSSPTSRYETPIIERALQKCYSSVSKVHSDLDNVSRQKERKKRSLQYVYSKFHIDRSLSDLNDSLFMLNTCITMSTSLSMNTLISTHLNSKLSGPDETPAVQESAVKVSKNISTTLAIGEQQRRPMKVNRFSSSRQSSWFLYEKLATFARDEKNKNERTHRSYLFGCPLLGTFVSLAVRYGSLSPLNLTLDTPRFIYEKQDKTLFDEIIRCAPGFGATSQDVSRWVARFNVTPNTQLVGRKDCRYSLFGFLVAWNKYETYKYLLDQGNQQLGSEQHVFYGLPFHATSSSSQQYETIKLYIDMRGPLLTVEEYAVILLPSRSPSVVVEMFDLFKDFFVDDMEDFAAETLEAIIGMFEIRHHQFDTETWASSVSKLLAVELDIHISSLYLGHTALHRIMTDDFATTIDALKCSEKWVEVLEHASVDVDRYLYIELMIQLETMELGFEVPKEWMAVDMKPWHAMDVRTRLEVLFDVMNPGRRVPLYVDSSSTNDLMQIMPALREATRYLLSIDHEGAPSHIDWKRSRMSENCSDSDSWPFLPTTASVHCSQRSLKNVSKQTATALESHDRFLQLMNDRFERRQQKKWERLKSTKTLAEKTEQMPGSWKMEWWEYQGGW